MQLAIDDFGTGYSSLSYLIQLQPDEIKIDKSFVMQMLRDESSAIIVRSTIDLAHGLGLKVVAEGVEDQATYDILRALGCDRMQGFLIAKAMSVGALSEWSASATMNLTPNWISHIPAQGAEVVALRRAGRSGRA